MEFFKPTNKFLFWGVILAVAVLVVGFGIWRGMIYKKSELPIVNNENTDNNDDIDSRDSNCIVSGCSGQICAKEEMMSTCQFLPEYACYKGAICERQVNSQCGWTMTEELRNCLNTAKSGDFNDKLEVY